MTTDTPKANMTDRPDKDADLESIPLLQDPLDLPLSAEEDEERSATAESDLFHANQEFFNDQDDAMTPSSTNERDALTTDDFVPPESQNTDAPELEIDLGYADALDAMEENEEFAEMEEIQTLQLAEMILEARSYQKQEAAQRAPETTEPPLDTHQQEKIAALEAIVFAPEDQPVPEPDEAPVAQPTQPSTAPQADKTTKSSRYFDETPPVVSALDAPSAVAPPAPQPVEAPPAPPARKGENPFLPQHILDRLNHGKRNLVEEIAQSSAALDASAAILRTHARAERLHRPSYADPKPQATGFTRDKTAMQKQKIIDDLVEDYLPLLAAELRRRLRKMLDD